MNQPMSPTSVFETTKSESSFISSESHKDIDGPDTPAPNHPHLNRLRKLAKVDAERQHAARVQNNMKKPRKTAIKKTSRQASNIRSAEICRAAKGFYTQHLEQAIVHEEEACLQITRAKFDQITAIVALKEKIEELEKKKAHMEKKRLWVKTKCEEAPVSNDVVDEDFATSDFSNETMKWEFETRNEYWSELENIEWFINDEMMCGGSSDMDVPMTPPPTGTESIAPTTPESKKRFQVETCHKKALRSPVSLFELAQEVPDEGALRPSLAA